MHKQTFRLIDTDEALNAAFPVMQALRPALASAGDFIHRVKRMHQEGYRLLAMREGSEVIALAGYRIQENLIYGRFLYVDDLIVAENNRGQQSGAALLSYLEATAVASDCEQLVLDTGLHNALAQRFYFRQGLLTSAIRFNKILRKQAQ